MRKHKFRVICKSRVTKWFGQVVFKDYEVAKRFKKRMEDCGFHCIMSTL